MQKFKTDEIVFVFGFGEIFQINGSNFHNRGDVELFEELFGLSKDGLGFGGVFSDYFTEARSHLDLLLEIIIFEKTQKYVSDLIIRLTIHNIIPVSVSDFNLLNLWGRFLDAFLKF